MNNMRICDMYEKYDVRIKMIQKLGNMARGHTETINIYE